MKENEIQKKPIKTKTQTCHILIHRFIILTHTHTHTYIYIYRERERERERERGYLEAEKGVSRKKKKRVLDDGKSELVDVTSSSTLCSNSFRELNFLQI